jgi:hypothetical protein
MSSPHQLAAVTEPLASCRAELNDPECTPDFRKMAAIAVGVSEVGVILGLLRTEFKGKDPFPPVGPRLLDVVRKHLFAWHGDRNACRYRDRKGQDPTRLFSTNGGEALSHQP